MKRLTAPLAFLALGACLSATATGAASATEAAAPRATPVLPSAMFRDYRAADLCMDLAYSFSQRDMALLERHFDVDGLVRKAVPAGLDPGVAAGIASGLRIKLLGSLMASITAERLQWTSRLQDEGLPDERCTLGAISDDGMVLLDLYLGRVNGALMITDTRNHGMARRTSELMYRLFASFLPLDALSAWTPGPASARLAALDGDDRVNRVLAFVRSLDGGDRAVMIERYESLPAEARREPVLLIRLIDGVRDDPVLYRRYLARLAALVGDDPDFSFMLFDHYVETGDKPRILRAQRQTDQKGSSLLPVLVLGVFAEREAGGAQGVRRSVSRLLEAHDGYEPLYWIIAEEASKRGDPETAVTALKVLQKRFGRDFSAPAQDEDEYLRRLRGSAPFQAWMARQQAAEPARP